MRHNKIIYLLSEHTTQDENLNEIVAFMHHKVYANEYSISSTEFYNAAVNDLKPEKSFEIYSFEYQGEEYFRFDGNLYRIIRTQGKGEKIIVIGEKITMSEAEINGSIFGVASFLQEV